MQFIPMFLKIDSILLFLLNLLKRFFTKFNIRIILIALTKQIIIIKVFNFD